MKKISVAYICTGNAIRSQMAEAYTRLLSEGKVEVESAGVAPAGFHPLAMEVLKEDQVPIIGQRSKSVDEIRLGEFDYIITLCGHAKEQCGVLPSSAKHIHWPIDDPVHFLGSEQQRLQRFRVTREEIRNRVAAFLKEILEEAN